MQFVFDWCVGFLVWWANAWGITYEELNVWLFVIVHPIVKGPSVADPLGVVGLLGKFEDEFDTIEAIDK